MKTVESGPIGNGNSFASLLKNPIDPSTTKAVRLTVMKNSENVQGDNVTIPLAVVEEINHRFENTLYGYFIGNRLVFPVVENYVKNAWAKYGLESLSFRTLMRPKNITLNYGSDCGRAMLHIEPIEGFLDSGDKKKKKKEGVSSTPSDEFPILSGIAKHVKNIEGKMNVPKSILKKAVRNVVNDAHEVVKPSHDGGSASKVSFETVGVSAKPSTTVDDATDFSPKSGGSFASLLKPNDATNKVHFRTLVNEERVESVDCVLPKAVAAKVKGRYDNSIVDFFLGKDPSFPVVQQYVSNTWRKFGFERITRNDDGVYLFKFATKSGRDQVIEKGPWMIRKSPIMLSKWSPSVFLKRGEVTKVPPIMLDAFTSSTCVESWGRISFARALIEIDAAVGLKKEVIMAIPDEEGDGYIKEVVRVEYEWKPPHCVDCKRFGHDTSLCPKLVCEEVPNNSARDAKAIVMEENDDGFTEVKSRKKKKGADSRSFGGLRMNKPNSKVIWQQKKGGDTKEGSKSASPSVSTYESGNGVSNPSLNTANPFDVLNVNGDDMGESRTQPKVSDHVNSVLDKIKDASKPSSSNSGYGDGHKDKNKSWVRNDYARALIEVSSLNPLQDSIVAAIPFPKGTGYTFKTVDIEYEWVPPRCDSCKKFDHMDKDCPKCVKEPLISRVEDDGFTKVFVLKQVATDPIKDNTQPATSYANSVEDLNLVSLRNYFESLMENDKILDFAKTSHPKFSVINIDPGDDDDDEEVKEVYNECNNIKGASTHSKEISRIILGWNHDIVNVVVISFSDQVLHTCVIFKPDKKELFCSFIYAHNRYIQRCALWQNLSIYMSYIRNRPWCILGDFNVSLTSDDSFVGTSCIDTCMHDFQDCVDSIRVSDVNSIGLHFTWNQKPKGDDGILKKINRIMDNIEFTTSFMGACAVFQPYRISDHSPAVLRLPTNSEKKPRPFKFYNLLVHNTRFKDVVANGWILSVSGFWMFKVVKRLKVLKKPLRNLLYNEGNVHENVKNIRHELDKVQKSLDANPSNPDLREEEAAYLKVFHTALILEEMFLVPLAFITHYTEFLGQPGVSTPFNSSDLFCNRLSIEASSNMIREVLDKEIWDVIISFGDNKAPGPEDFSAAFFKEAWSIISIDYCSKLNIINLCFADDLFLFVHGDADSARVIIDSLEEFKDALGLTPSLPKITAYFCNVLNYVKIEIINILLFEEAKLLVKYLGVPLVPSRLVYCDCAELIERIKRRVSDWKNKSLSFTGRAQLIRSVLESMHLCWASVFILPSSLILELEQVMRCFLWCQGEMKKGKAKVAWDALCLHMRECGLGICRMETFNKSLISSHIWSLLSGKEWLWVKWIHSYKLNGRSFWDIPLRGNMSWGWRKILQVRHLVRPFLWSWIGNGSTTYAWYDIWCSLGPLSNVISNRDIYRAGFRLDAKVSDIFSNGAWACPLECMGFSVASIWECLHPKNIEVDWFHVTVEVNLLELLELGKNDLSLNEYLDQLGDWFSFAKRRAPSPFCIDDNRSCIKHWKSGFFLIDRRAISNFMVWKHPNAAIDDPRPVAGSFSMADVHRLSVRVIKLRDMPEGVLVLSGLSRVWKSRVCDPASAEVQEEPHLDVRILAKAEASQKRKASTSGATSSHVAKRTRSALAQSSGSTTRPSLFVDNSDNGSDDDDACVEILLVTLIRSAAVIPFLRNQSGSSTAPTAEGPSTRDSQGKGIMADDAAASSIGVSQPRPSSGHVPSFRDVSEDAIHTDFFLFPASPCYATYPEGSIARNYEFTREEWDASYRPTFGVLTKRVFNDPAVFKTVVDQFPTSGEMVRVESLPDDQLNTKMSVLHSDSRLKGYKEKIASLIGGMERKKKIKSLTRSLDNLHAEVTRLSSDLNRATVLEAEKDEEILCLMATPLKVQCELLSLAASAGFERGLSMHWTKDEFAVVLKKMAHFVPAAQDRLAEASLLVAQTNYAFLDKIFKFSVEPLSVILQLEPEKFVRPANIPTSRDDRVSPPIAKESTVTPAFESLELSANVVLSPFVVAFEQNEEWVNTMVDGPGVEMTDGAAYSKSGGVFMQGISHVLYDVAEVSMVGSGHVSLGLTDVVVVLFAGEKGDSSLNSFATDEEAIANLSRLGPLGLNKVITFEVLCRSLQIEPTVTLFRVFHTLRKQGDWFSFAKRRAPSAFCIDNNLSCIKHWKSGFFLIDRRAISDSMVWDIQTRLLMIQVLTMYLDVRSTLQRLPFYSTPPAAVDAIILDATLEDLVVVTPSSRILAEAEASQKRKASTSGATSSHVAKRSRSALAQSSGSTTRPSLFVDNSDDGSDDDDDACDEILLVTLVRSATVIPSSRNQSGSSTALATKGPGTRDSQGRDIMADDVAASSIVDQFPTSGEMVRVESLPDDQLNTKINVLHCMMMSYGVSTIKKQVSGLNDKLSSADASFAKSKARGMERKKKIKSLTRSLDNLYAEVTRLSVDLNRATILVAEKDKEIVCLKATPSNAGFERGLSMHRTKDEFAVIQHPHLKGCSCFNVDGDDMGESGTEPKVSEYVSSDLNENKKEASKPSSSKSVYGDGHKDKNVSSPPVLKKWDVINEDDTTDDEDVFTSYVGSLGGGNQLEDGDFDFYGSYADQVVDLDGALKEFCDFKLSMSEFVVTPAFESLELSANVVLAPFVVASEQNEEWVNTMVDGPGIEITDGAAHSMSRGVFVQGTSHVLDDVAEVSVVGSGRVSSSLTDVVVALFPGEKVDSSLTTFATDEEATANLSILVFPFPLSFFDVRLSIQWILNHATRLRPNGFPLGPLI
uniref:DUF4283 domain-containing protein n=1 Tax=Tanacetum cinerariifolium TaxID=118510 RepID=A0A6L2M695_TANCI|nr:hypothetical protein [Tanacetum cinerariifolium]